MENYKEKTRKRRPSCPLLITDKTGGKFKIYDKDFLPSVGGAPTASHTPVEKKLSADF